MMRFSGLFLWGLAAVATTALSPASSLHAKDKPQYLQLVNQYADLADLALGAPITVEATILKAKKLSEKISPGIPAGHVRFLVTGEVTRLIASTRSLPSEITYLVDMPLDSRGKPPKIKGARALLFLKPSAGRTDQFALATPNSQIAWTEQTNQMIRNILTEANGPSGRLEITGIGNAFYVPGTVPGESETQIFLTTADQSPVSLSVLRRPGEAPRWSVSLGEMVDESSKPAGRDTLLWYHLACFLPEKMPEPSITGSSPDDRNAIASDYAFVMQQLGACGRQLPQR